MRVLVIDYDEQIRAFLTKALRLYGHDVKALPRAGEVPIHLDLRRCDALLIEAMTPAIDGIGYAKIARDHGFRGPIAIASGLFPRNALAREAPFDYYLAKPFLIADLDGLLRGDPCYLASLPLGDDCARRLDEVCALRR